MAIITVSRQIASLGDEVCKSIAGRLGYKFVSRGEIEKKIIELGFPKSKLEKFDEKKPDFLSSLTNARDEYLDYLQLAILESAENDNCVIIGRGSFIILQELPNNISLKFVANKKLRIERYKAEHKCSEKYAQKIVNESDSNRDGFNKSFFDFDINNPAMFHLVVNTGLIDIDAISFFLEVLVKKTVTAEKTSAGMKIIKERAIEQKIVILLKYKNLLEIKFLRVEVKENAISIYGVSESHVQAEKAVEIIKNEFSDYKIISCLSFEN